MSENEGMILTEDDLIGDWDSKLYRPAAPRNQHTVSSWDLPSFIGNLDENERCMLLFHKDAWIETEAVISCAPEYKQYKEMSEMLYPDQMCTPGEWLAVLGFPSFFFTKWNEHDGIVLDLLEKTPDTSIVTVKADKRWQGFLSAHQRSPDQTLIGKIE